MDRARAVIFDFDGVIADTEDLHFTTFAASLAAIEIHVTREEADQHYLGLTDRAAFEKAFREAGRPLDEQGTLALIDDKGGRYQKAIAEIELFPGAAELIRATSATVPLGIASSGLRDDIDPVLRRHALRDAFRFLVTADDGIASKPDPALYLRALTLLRTAELAGLLPQDCLVIEDSPRGIEAAKRAGMRCVAVRHTCADDQLSHADRVVSSLVELVDEWTA